MQKPKGVSRNFELPSMNTKQSLNACFHKIFSDPKIFHDTLKFFDNLFYIFVPFVLSAVSIFCMATLKYSAWINLLKLFTCPSEYRGQQIEKHCSRDKDSKEHQNFREVVLRKFQLHKKCLDGRRVKTTYLQSIKLHKKLQN